MRTVKFKGKEKTGFAEQHAGGKVASVPLHCAQNKKE
jgi:hypothetical protein